MEYRHQHLLRISAVFFALSFLLLAFTPQPSIAAEKDKGIIIRNNVLSDSGFGVYVGPRDDEMLIENNVIKKNAEAIRLTGVKNKTFLRYNDIKDNLVGITIRDRYSDNEKGYIDYPVDIEDIIITDNQFSNNEDGNILNLLRNEDGEDSTATETAEVSTIPDNETETGGTSTNADNKAGEETAEKIKKIGTEGKTGNGGNSEATKEITNNPGEPKQEEPVEQIEPQEPVEEKDTSDSLDNTEPQVETNTNPNYNNKTEGRDSPATPESNTTNANSGNSIVREEATNHKEQPTETVGSSLGDYAWLIGGTTVLGLTALLLLIKN